MGKKHTALLNTTGNPSRTTVQSDLKGKGKATEIDDIFAGTASKTSTPTAVTSVVIPTTEVTAKPSKKKRKRALQSEEENTKVHSKAIKLSNGNSAENKAGAQQPAKPASVTIIDTSSLPGMNAQPVGPRKVANGGHKQSSKQTAMNERNAAVQNGDDDDKLFRDSRGTSNRESKDIPVTSEALC